MGPEGAGEAHMDPSTCWDRPVCATQDIGDSFAAVWFVFFFYVARARPGRPGDALAGETRFLCFAPHKRTRAHGPPRQVAERGANKPQTHTQRTAHSTLRSRVRRVPALLPRSPPRGRARTSGHAAHARSESRVSGALCVCLWFVCASFRDLARRAARSCALVLRKT